MSGQWRHRRDADPDLARLVRALVARRSEVLALDPWLPFPQNGCCFLFGAQSRPLPVGALVLLWDRWTSATGTCGACGGQVFATAFGGLLAVGGVRGCCLRCGRAHFLPIGGLSAVAAEVGPHLAGGEFRITRALFGGAAAGPRRPLWEALRCLGAQELPEESWAEEQEPLAVSFRLGRRRGWDAGPGTRPGGRKR